VTARGLHLLLPEGVAAAEDALRERLSIASGASGTLEREYWDTFDGRLHAEGLALVATDGRLSLSDAAGLGEQAGADFAPIAGRLAIGDLPGGALRDALAPLVEMRALTPIARVRSRLTELKVLDDDDTTVVRLTAEAPSALAGGEEAALGDRLHVTGVRGYDGALRRVRAVLEDDLGLEAAPRPVQDDAVAASGGTPGGVASKVRVALTPEQRADAAAAAILRALADVIDVNLPGTLADVDSEFLHDLRVAVRRTRSVQRELKGVFEPEALRRFRARFRDLQQLTGPTRDLDVHLLDLEELADVLPPTVVPDLEPLRTLLAGRRVAEQRRMARTLRAPATRALLGEWRAQVEGLPGAPSAGRPDAARPIADVAAERIARVHRQMVRMGRAIDDASPPEALHELRKKGKELRYLLEFFAGLYPAAVVKPMVASLKRLQDVLGRFQDRDVQTELLESLSDEVAALERGPAAVMAMGVLVDRLKAEQARARAEFADRFAAFAAKDQRRLVRQTFA
jgi:CHAD domain-containing protein